MSNLNISFSSSANFKRCPERFHLQNVLRVKTREEGASLAFGTAIDNALRVILEYKRDGLIMSPTSYLCKALDLFNLDKDKGWEAIFDNPKYKYSMYDYTPKVLKPEDKELITLWEKQLYTTVSNTVSAMKSKAYKSVPQADETLWNRLCWITLKRKGEMLIKAFIEEHLPKISNIQAVQHKIDLPIDNNVTVKGYVDLVANYEGYKDPIIIDLKTSSRLYKFDAIKLSEQLLLYTALVGKQFNTNLAGFIVLCKQFDSEIYCSICGSKKESKHQTCAAEIGGRRCGGEWKEVPKATIQVMVEPIAQESQSRFLKEFQNVAKCISSGVRFRNFDSCHDYNSLCPMFHLCHYGDKDSVIWETQKDKDNYLKE